MLYYTFYLNSQPKRILNIAWQRECLILLTLSNTTNTQTSHTHTHTQASTGATNKLHRQMNQSPARLCSLHSPVWTWWKFPCVSQWTNNSDLTWVSSPLPAFLETKFSWPCVIHYACKSVRGLSIASGDLHGHWQTETILMESSEGIT